MEQQKILRKRVVDLLGLKLTSEEGVNLFRNSEFQFDDEDMLLMPHVKKPLKWKSNAMLVIRFLVDCIFVNRRGQYRGSLPFNKSDVLE